MNIFVQLYSVYWEVHGSSIFLSPRCFSISSSLSPSLSHPLSPCVLPSLPLIRLSLSPVHPLALHLSLPSIPSLTPPHLPSLSPSASLPSTFSACRSLWLNLALSPSSPHPLSLPSSLTQYPSYMCWHLVFAVGNTEIGLTWALDADFHYP